jgi:tetratricopeptide (TPR) repeat protein
LPKVEKLTRRALELDGRSAMGHFTRGMILGIRDWNFEGASGELQEAVAADPKFVQGWMGYSRILVARGKLTEAQQALERALRLDPASPLLGADYCQVFYMQSDFARAELECRKVLEREPGFALAGYYLALSLGMMGRTDEAEGVLAKSPIRPGGVEADRAWLRLLRGDRHPAMVVLEDRRRSIREGDMDASAKLLLATILGNRDEALEALEAGISVRAPELLNLAAEPRLEALRSDPRAAAVLRGVGIGAH